MRRLQPSHFHSSVYHQDIDNVDMFSVLHKYSAPFVSPLLSIKTIAEILPNDKTDQIYIFLMNTRVSQGETWQKAEMHLWKLNSTQYIFQFQCIFSGSF